MARKQNILLLVCVIALCSCGGMSKGERSSQGEMEEIEFIKPVEEPPSDVVDTIGFPEESQGTPIKGYQGYPEDDLVHESKEDEVAGFEGGADIDYYNGGGSDGY